MAVVEAVEIRGGWRVIAGQKDGVDVVVEATGAKVKDDQVRAVLTVRVGDAVAFKSICNMTYQPNRAKVLEALQAKGIAVEDGMLLVLEEACRMPPPRREGPSATRAEATRTVPLPELLAEIMDYIGRYMVIGKEALVATALWIAHTYAIDAAEVTPYLNVNSPDKRCGKSRFLELLQGLVARAWYILRPTEAVLFRKIEKGHPTVLIDEIDTIFKDKSPSAEGLRALLDAGNRRGIKVPRCVGDKHDIVEFDTFCPRALAGIGKAVPDTVVDRSIKIGLVRKKKTEQRARLRARKIAAETAAIRAALNTWASAATIARLREAEPALPEALDDRAADGWEPLLAIADEAGGEFPELARRAAAVLHGAESDGEGEGVRLLRAIYEVFEERKAERIFTRDLLTALVERESEPWGSWWGKDVAQAKPGETPRGPAVKLAALLRPFDVRPKDIRIGEDTGKGYDRADFADAFDRYLAHASDEQKKPEKEPEEPKATGHPASPPSGDATTRHPAPDAELRAKNEATASERVASSRGAEALAAEGLSRCRVVDGRDGGPGEAEGFEEGVI